MNSITKEEFRQIPHLPDYEISKMGIIRNMETKHILKQAPGWDKYLRVFVRVDKKNKCCLVHRILAIVFIPNPENFPVINHKNGNRLDNRLENLEWCTQRDNVRHASQTGLIPSRQGEAGGRSKLRNHEVLKIRELLKEGVGITKIARKFNTSAPNIHAIKNGRSWRNI